MLIAAAVLLVSCAPEVPDPDPVISDETIDIYFSKVSDDCSETVAVQRESGAETTLATALQDLLAGPTEQEKAEGVISLFNDETKDLLISAEIEDGIAKVDFEDLRPVIPNASSSCGSTALLAQLDRTVEQFGAEQTLYSLNGDLTTFYEWLQLAVPDA